MQVHHERMTQIMTRMRLYRYPELLKVGDKVTITGLFSEHEGKTYTIIEIKEQKGKCSSGRVAFLKGDMPPSGGVDTSWCVPVGTPIKDTYNPYDEPGFLKSKEKKDASSP